MFAQLQASLANASAAARAAVTGAANANAQADVKTANATKMLFEAERLELERHGDTSDAQSDGHLESKMIKPSKRVLCGVSKKQAVARGRELNAVMGTRTTLEDNVGGQTPEREREHRAILKHRGLKVMLARAAMRKLVFPAIRRQLEQPLQLLAATVDDDSSSTSAVPVLVPRIPVRSQEGTLRPELPTLTSKTRRQLLKHASQQQEYEVSGVLLNFPVVSYYNKAMKQALAYVVKRGDRAMEVIAVLSGDAGAAAALNRPCCLVNLSRSCGVSRI